MQRKGGADEALHKTNKAINSRKLNRTKLSTIACDVKRGVIFVWHCVHDVKRGFIFVWHCVHDVKCGFIFVWHCVHDVKRGFIFVWHCVHDVKRGFIFVWHCVHDFCFLLVMRKERQLFIIDNAC
jgi:hypothetical protein